MKNLRLLLLVLVAALLPLAAAAQDHPNQARGFAPDKLYSFFDLDTVNTFNGNLNISIPIGQKYTVGGGLTYGLTLVYNSSVWDYRTETVNGEKELYIYANRRSNAGMGWQLTLGELYPPQDPLTNSGQWIFAGSDGGQHTFYDNLHGEAPPSTVTTYYTRDSSYLRMRAGTTEMLVDFPDGSTYQFQKLLPQAGTWPVSTSSSAKWKLTKISDRFGNELNIGYSTPSGYAEQWTLSDGTRTHTVYFRSASGQYSKVLDKVDLTANGGTAAYDFEYTDDVVVDKLIADDVKNPSGPVTTVTVSLLQRVVLPAPDGNTTSARAAFVPGTYATTGTTSGTLGSLTFPTMGSVGWTYTYAPFPASSSDNPAGDHSIAVSTRSIFDASGSSLGTWTYRRILGGLRTCIVTCANGSTSCQSGSDRQLTGIVTAPDGTQTISYYSGYSYLRQSRTQMGDECSTAPEGWFSPEYGLPFTRYAPEPGNTGRFLASEVRTGTLPATIPAFEGKMPSSWPGTATQVVRSVYVAYDYDSDASNISSGPSRYDKNRRERSRTTYFNDDSGCGATAADTCYATNDNSGFDGYGHYRQVTSTSNFPFQSPRVDFTNYIAPAGTSWQLDQASERCSAAGTATATSCASLTAPVTTRIQYDSSTGAVTAQRMLANGASRSGNDVLVTYTRDAKGNVTVEKYSGGDTPGGLSTGVDFPASPTAAYTLSHTLTYDGRVLTGRKSQYAGQTEYVVDETYDKDTGLTTSSRDTAGVETTYTYDRLGHPLTVTAPGNSSTTFTFTDAASSPFTPARVGISTGAGDQSISSEVQYDAMGRVWREKTLMPDGSWSVRQTLYDAMGRKTSVSEHEQLPSTNEYAFVPAHVTTFSAYDAFGRPGAVTAPDGTSMTFAYGGTRTSTRNSSLAGPTSTITVSTVDEYDAAGRLRQVTEPTGATSAAAPVGGSNGTTYTYDVAGRLTTVTATPQVRTFNYDGRGFLLSETHPESGTATFTYDPKGHVLSKTAADSAFNLKFEYDFAERLLRVRGWDPGSSAYRLIKEYTFATANGTGDYRLGKLLTATRYNYPSSTPGDAGSDTITVTETYAYKDSAGRRTDKQTSIVSSASGALISAITEKVAFNTEGLLSEITYPSCATCGKPPGDTRVVTPLFTHGRVTEVPEFVSQTYLPTGQWSGRSHSNGVEDVQGPDSYGMARPRSFSSSGFIVCNPPVISTPTGGTTVSPASPTTVLSVVASGTAPFQYQWYAAGQAIVGATGSSYTASPTATTSYTVKVTNACATVTSAPVVVTYCGPPSITSAMATRNDDGTATLTGTATGSGTLTYAWYQMPAHTLIGSSATVQTSPITATTTYQFEVRNSCVTSAVTATAIARVYTMPANGLQALRTSTSQITVTWPPSPDAPRYRVEWFYGGAWNTLATTTATQFVDSAVPALTVRFYRVRAVDANGMNPSSPGNADVASTLSFTTIDVGTEIAAAHFEDLRTAVNAARTARGWSTLTWTQILPAGDLAPGAGGLPLASHIMKLRFRMDEVLNSLGITGFGYTDPDCTGQTIKRVHLTELQERVR